MPLSWWFSDGEVLSSVIFIGLSLSGWVKIFVCQAITLSSYYETSFICWGYWMQTSSYGMLAQLVGEFLGNLKYSELLSLSPELASDVTSLSGSASILSVAVGTSVGREWFELFYHY